VYEPVQRILDQVRSVKVPASWVSPKPPGTFSLTCFSKLVAELESVSSSSSALIPEMQASLASLATSVSNAVDIAVQVSFVLEPADMQLAQRIAGHVASLKVSKEPLRLKDIEGFLKEVTREQRDLGEPWEVIGLFVNRLGAEVGAVLPRIRTSVKVGQLVRSEFDMVVT
jgi:dynactin 1